MKKVLLFILLVAGWSAISSAQEVAVKTNGLYWLTTTPNIGMEFGLGRKVTLDISGAYNPWTWT